MLYIVATSEQFSAPLPCLIVRSPVTSRDLESTPMLITITSEYYEEGPICAAYLSLYDLPPEIDVVTLPHRIKGLQIVNKGPFWVECLLNPTAGDNRLLLRALAASPTIQIEFYLYSPSLPYQGTIDIPNSEALQQQVKEILATTQIILPSTEEEFMQAYQRFINEHQR